MPHAPGTTVALAPPVWWPRLLALQILQVTSLSITLSLAYDSSTLQSPLDFSTSTTPTTEASGGTSTTASGGKSSGRGRKKKGSKSGQRHLLQPSHHPSDTENEDGDDACDNHGQSPQPPEPGPSSSGVNHAHVHYPLYQSGSEPVGSSLMDPTDSASSGGGKPHFVTLLSKGLAVTVNGSPWRSVAAHVIQGEDEAVVVIYGLSPGRDYLIELGLVGEEERRFAEFSIVSTTSSVLSHLDAFAGSNSAAVMTAHSSGVNASSPSIRSRSRANSLRSRSRANSASHGASSNPPRTLFAVASQVVPSTAPPVGSALASPKLPLPDVTGTDVDSVTSLLRYHLAQSSAQEAHLASELKSHRRTSQKSEAALRANIAALQKTLEKSSVADLRARQKALALGESVKRLTSGKEEVEAEREKIELQVGDEGAQRDAGLEEAEKIRRKEWDLLKVEAAAVEEERDRVVGENDKTVAGWETELNGLLARLDKLNVKHDRLTTQMVTLNDRLEIITREKAEISTGTHPALREAALSYSAQSQTSQRGDHNYPSRGRPPPVPRGGAFGGLNNLGRPYRSVPPHPASGDHSQSTSSTSPLQISAAPFRPNAQQAGPHHYHRSSPSFTVQIPHPSTGSVSNAQNAFAVAHAQQNPYSPVFAPDGDEIAPEPAAFPPLPSQAKSHSPSPPPSLAHASTYSSAAVAQRPPVFPPGRPNYASFSSASPLSSPALANAQIRQQDGFAPHSPVNTFAGDNALRSGSLDHSASSVKGTPDASERAAAVPLPLSPTVDR